MKRLLLSIVCLLATIIGLQAQNANRSGVFVELQGGAAFGTVMDKEIRTGDSWYDYDYIRQWYIKGGFVGSFNVGYRYATSNQFAIEMKAGAWGNFQNIDNTFTLDMLPGIRWTTKEISGNVSMFLSLNAGCGLNFINGDVTTLIPVEVGVGVNLTNQLYAGVFLSERIATGAGIGYTTTYYPQTHTTAGIKIGYRF